MKRDFTEADKFELRRAVEEKFGAKLYYSTVFKCMMPGSISREASFAKKVLELGCDKIEAGIWGINVLGLNKNALNSEYNNIEKLPVRVNYFG